MTTGKNSSSTRPISPADDKQEAERREKILEQAKRENAHLREKVATSLNGLRKIAGN